jgi:DNA-binding PadR family transcriptional regulator
MGDILRMDAFLLLLNLENEKYMTITQIKNKLAPVATSTIEGFYSMLRRLHSKNLIFSSLTKTSPPIKRLSITQDGKDLVSLWEPYLVYFARPNTEPN